MLLTYRGSVNRWECDENDHLNVRFYVEKHWQTVCGWLLAGSADAHLTVTDLVSRLDAHHLRFLQESRLAAPLSGYAGVVALEADRTLVLTELRHSFTDEVVCTCVHHFRGLALPVTDQLPDYAAARGVPAEDLQYTAVPMTEVGGLGFQRIGAGVIQAAECQSNGELMPHNYMGRISDSMPHLWGELSENEGGAVLEYRLRYHQPLCRGQPFVVMSGIAAVGAKVQRFAHLIFAADTGVLCVSAEAAAVRMDLHARRAVTLSEEWQARLRERMLQPFVE